MKTILLIISVLLISSVCFAEVRGTTQTEFSTEGSVYEQARRLSPQEFQLLIEKSSSTRIKPGPAPRS